MGISNSVLAVHYKLNTYVSFLASDTDTETDTLLTKKAWAPQGINDIHVQMAQMSVYKITYY